MSIVLSESFYPKVLTQFNFERLFNRGFELKGVKGATGQRHLGEGVSQLINPPSMGISGYFLKAMGFSVAILFQFVGHSRQFHLQLLVYKYHYTCN